MKTICSVTVLIFLLFIFSCSLFSQENSKNEQGLRLTDSPTWREDMYKKIAELDKLTDFLITVAAAKDKPKPSEMRDTRERANLGEKRLYAIAFLAKLGTRKAIQFLVDNITINLEPMKYLSDIDDAKDYPCRYALEGISDWRAASYILKVLEQKKTGKEIQYFAIVFNKVPGKRLALTIIQSEIEAFKDDKDKKTYINNLNQIKQYLDNPEK